MNRTTRRLTRQRCRRPRASGDSAPCRHRRSLSLHSGRANVENMSSVLKTPGPGRSADSVTRLPSLRRSSENPRFQSESRRGCRDGSASFVPRGSMFTNFARLCHDPAPEETYGCWSLLYVLTGFRLMSEVQLVVRAGYTPQRSVDTRARRSTSRTSTHDRKQGHDHCCS